MVSPGRFNWVLFIFLAVCMVPATSGADGDVPLTPALQGVLERLRNKSGEIVARKKLIEMHGDQLLRSQEGREAFLSLAYYPAHSAEGAISLKILERMKYSVHDNTNLTQRMIELLNGARGFHGDPAQSTAIAIDVLSGRVRQFEDAQNALISFIGNWKFPRHDTSGSYEAGAKLGRELSNQYAALCALADAADSPRIREFVLKSFRNRGRILAHGNGIGYHLAPLAAVDQDLKNELMELARKGDLPGKGDMEVLLSLGDAIAVDAEIRDFVLELASPKRQSGASSPKAGISDDQAIGALLILKNRVNQDPSVKRVLIHYFDEMMAAKNGKKPFQGALNDDYRHGLVAALAPALDTDPALQERYIRCIFDVSDGHHFASDRHMAFEALKKLKKPSEKTIKTLLRWISGNTSFLGRIYNRIHSVDLKRNADAAMELLSYYASLKPESSAPEQKTIGYRDSARPSVSRVSRGVNPIAAYQGEFESFITDYKERVRALKRGAWRHIYHDRQMEEVTRRLGLLLKFPLSAAQRQTLERTIPKAEDIKKTKDQEIKRVLEKFRIVARKELEKERSDANESEDTLGKVSRVRIADDGAASASRRDRIGFSDVGFRVTHEADCVSEAISEVLINSEAPVRTMRK